MKGAGDKNLPLLSPSLPPRQGKQTPAMPDRAETIKDPLARWSYLHVNLPRAENATSFGQNFKMWWE
jgi:hypothetical protein